MNEQGNVFLQSWNDLKNIVLEKFPTANDCIDHVEFLKNSGLSKLDKAQIGKLLLLRNIHDVIEKCQKTGFGVEEAMSASITEELISELKEITAAI